MKQHFPRAAWILTILAATHGTLPAENFNVSRMVTGTSTSYNFAAGAAKPMLAGVTLVHHFNRLVADISSEDTARFLHSWNADWKSAPEYHMLERTEDTPAPTASLVYRSPYYQQARVDMATGVKFVKATVFRSGDAAAKVSYSLRIQHTGANPADYVLTHQVPALVTGHAQAFSLCCPGDLNGGTYRYMRPTAVSIRAAADLYVNGLAIWSSGKTHRFPEGSLHGSAHLDTQWGGATDTGLNRFFLGRLSQGQTLIVTYVTRGDAINNAPNCGTVHYGAGATPERSCTQSTAQVDMPSLGVAVGFKTVGLTVKVHQP